MNKILNQWIYEMLWAGMPDGCPAFGDWLSDTVSRLEEIIELRKKK